MKVKTKVKLLILLIVCLAAALIAGCGEMTKDDYLKKNGASGQSVTYFANGGRFNDKSREVMELYFKPGSPVLLNIETNNFKVARTNYTFDAWYYTMVDDDGNLMLKDGEPVYGAKVGEGDVVGEGKHLYVIAGWTADIAIDVILVADGFDVTDGEGNTYKSGDTINTLNFITTSPSYGLSEKSTGLTADNATYLYFYEDEACTKPITSVTKPEQAEENVKVYAKYLQGKWTIVKTAEEVRKMFYSDSGNFYLFTPDGSNVIDCSKAGMTLNSYDFNLVIEGNGVVLDKVTFEEDGLANSSFSALGKLKSGSSIRNLTFKNVSFTAKVSLGYVEIFLFCHGAEEGAVIENIVIDTVKVNISKPKDDDVLVTNINRDNGVKNTDNWLFGGYDTDDSFLEKFDGIEVKNASLIFRNEPLVENISK